MMKKNYVERKPSEVYAVKVKELHTELMNEIGKSTGIEIGIQSRIENELTTLHLGEETMTVGHNDVLVIDHNGARIYGMNEFYAIYEKL